MKRGDDKNGIAVHVQRFNHRIDWDNARVQEVVPDYWKGMATEAIQIYSTTQSMNLDCGLNLSNIWNPLLNSVRVFIYLVIHFLLIFSHQSLFNSSHFHPFQCLQLMKTFWSKCSILVLMLLLFIIS